MLHLVVLVLAPVGSRPIDPVAKYLVIVMRVLDFRGLLDTPLCLIEIGPALLMPDLIPFVVDRLRLRLP